MIGANVTTNQRLYETFRLFKIHLIIQILDEKYIFFRFLDGYDNPFEIMQCSTKFIIIRMLKF